MTSILLQMKLKTMVNKKTQDKNKECANVNLDDLSAYFSRDSRVAAATVFGSAQDGIVRPGSDLDLGVLFTEALNSDEYLEFYTELCEEVPSVENLDLVSLNEADPILAFEAINGRFLCKNDLEKAADFVSLVSREYEDVMGNLEHQRRLAA